MDDKELERLAWLRAQRRSEKWWALAGSLAEIAIIICVLAWILIAHVTNYTVPILVFILVSLVTQLLLYWNHRSETKRYYEQELLELKKNAHLKDAG